MRDYLRPRYLVAVAVILVVAFVGLRTNHTHATPPAAAPSSAPATPAGVAGTPTGTPSPPPGGAVSQTPSTGTPAEIATKFVGAWASRGETEAASAWLARMRPYASETLLGQLAHVPPGAIEAHRVTAPATTLNEGQYGAQVVVPVDAGPAVLCGLTNDGQRWLVTTLDTVDPGQS